MDKILSSDEINDKLNKCFTFPNNPEIWSPINLEICPYVTPGIYYVSTWGKVFSSSRNKLLAFEMGNTGYFRVNLSSKGKNTDSLSQNYATTHVSVHRLVLGTFSPMENMKDYEVNHRDGVKINNNLYNLEWVTCSENAQHAIRTGLFKNWKLGDECSWKKITSEQADLIGQLLISRQYTQKQISNIIGCSKQIVCFIANGFAWRDVYYKYNLRKIKNRLTSNFSNEDHVKIRSYIKSNLYKYIDTDLRFLCMDLMKDLFNLTMNKSMYVELMDIIADIQEGII